MLLESAPVRFKPSEVYQNALMETGIPYTQFDVESVGAGYERLTTLGVEFSVKLTVKGVAKIAVFNDTCGNNIQIVEML